MKQSTASKTLLAIITILTVMMALIVPSPAYAANEPPPPPPPPSNDTGGNGGKPSHSSVKDLPADTTVVVTDNGTPLSLASQLTVDALSGPVSDGSPTPVNYVKFCKADNTDFNAGDCSSYTTIENAITFVKGLNGASGVFYVDVNYPVATVPPYKSAIQLDQSTFFSPTAATDLDLLGGVHFSGGFAGQQGLNPTVLVQPLTISNFNADSNVTVDLFQFNISGYKNTGTLLHPVYDADSAVAVVKSNNVTLTDLTINETSNGNGIKVDTSNNVTINSSSDDKTTDVTETKTGRAS